MDNRLGGLGLGMKGLRIVISLMGKEQAFWEKKGDQSLGIGD